MKREETSIKVESNATQKSLLKVKYLVNIICGIKYVKIACGKNTHTLARLHYNARPIFQSKPTREQDKTLLFEIILLKIRRKRNI